MAKFVDKDPFEYEQEKQSFLQDLEQFHSSRGSPFKTRPKIAGLELDLYLLYLKVTALGGIHKVTDAGLWDGILECFSLKKNCSHAANALRQHYIRYLELYEKIHFLGEDEDDRAGPGGRPSTPQGSKESQGYARSSKPVERPILESLISEYDKLVYSLMSGLPNEIDFAINVCTLLSNEGRHILHLAKVPQIIDLLLAHTGIFFEGSGSYRMLYEECWKLNVERDFVKFWYDTVTDSEVREIIGPESLKPPDNTIFKNGELFCQRKLGLSDVEGQRVLQIAIILRNLSFEIPNKPIMAAHRTLYRFLLLCIHNSCSMLRQIGMDTLSNIADEFVLDSIAYRSTQLMFHSVYKGLKDNDRYIVLRSMEVLEKLLEVEQNLFILQECLEHQVYETVVRTLIIPDIQLLLEALEVLLVMSEKGEPFCTNICKVTNSINVLVCLVTMDAQSLGAEAFCGIKIIDRNPDLIQQPSVARASSVHSATPPPPTSSQPSQHPPAARSPARHQSMMPPPPPSSATPPAQTTGMTSKEAECEKFACQWLACHYEAEQDATVTRVELYADYLSACSRIARGNILSSNNFAKCLRMIFPQVGIKKVDGSGLMQIHLLGIRKRNNPIAFRWDPGPAPQNEPAMSTLSRPASTMMVRLAQRHSPSSNVTPSPPPSRTYMYQQAQHGHLPAQAPPSYHSALGSTAQIPQPHQQIQVPPSHPPPSHPSDAANIQQGVINVHSGSINLQHSGVNIPAGANMQMQLSGGQIILQGHGTSNVTFVPAQRLPQPPQYSSQDTIGVALEMAVGAEAKTVIQPDNNQPDAISKSNLSHQTQDIIQLPSQTSSSVCQTVPVPQGTPTSVSSQGSLDFPQPPLSPPINPMLDALSPSGTPTNIPASPSMDSKNPPAEKNPSAMENEIGKTYSESNSDMLDGEIKIKKVTNDKEGDENSHSVSSATNYSQSKYKTFGNEDYAQQINKNTENPSSTAPEGVESGNQAASASKGPLQPGGPTAVADTIKVIPTYPGTKPLHISQGMTVVHNNQIVQQVMPGKVTSIQNVLVPQPGIVFNVQPMVQGQVQLMPQNISFSQSQTIQLHSGQTVNFQPRQHVSIQPKHPVNIQPKQNVNIQPKPLQQSKVNGQNKPVVSTGFQIPQGKAVNIQPTQTIVHQGQPMVALQRPVVQSQQIVLGQYAVVQPTQQVLQQQQAQTKVSKTGPVATSSQAQGSVPSSTNHNPAFLNFGRVSQCTQNSNTLTTDSPLIKQLLKQSSPLPSQKQEAATQQQNATVQIVQHQGQFVAVNQWPAQAQNASQAFARQQLVSIAPRPSGPGQPYTSHLVVSVPHQPTTSKVQYGPDGGSYPVGYMSSPTSSTSSSSKSKKKKSKKSKSKSKKKHKDKKSASPGMSESRRDDDVEEEEEDTPKSQSPSDIPTESGHNGPTSTENAVQGRFNPTGGPLILPVTAVSAANPSNLAVALVEDSGLKRTYGVMCNGNPVGAATKKKPPKSPKREVKKKKVVNGVGEEHLLPIEVKIERIENPSHILNQKQTSGDRDVDAGSGDEESLPAVDKDSVISEDVDPKPVVGDILEEAMKEISPGRNKTSFFMESSDENSQDSMACGSDISVDKKAESLFQEDFVVNEKLATDEADVKETVVNHIMNGQILEKKITAGLEKKLQKEIEKTLKRTLENEMKENSLEKCDISRTGRYETQNGDGLCNENAIHTNGPSRYSEAINVLNVNTKQSVPNGPDLTISNPQQTACKVGNSMNGHVLPSPNTSLSSSPLSSPPSVDPNLAPNSLSQGQALFPPSPASTCSDTRTATPEPRGHKRTMDESVRMETPGQIFVGSMSPPPVSEGKKSKSSKKRRSSSTSSNSSKKDRHSKSDKSKTSPPVNPMLNFYLCEWAGCNKSLPSAKALHNHACTQHVIASCYRGICEWEGCDNIQRQRWSTVTHIQEKHCAEDALLAAAERRAQQALQSIPPRDPNALVQPVVYTAHTAYHAIRRSLVSPALKDLLGESEGPVTKSIRITASLILKNITEYSEDGRELIKVHESTLSLIALSTVESASTISKCLFILQNEGR